MLIDVNTFIDEFINKLSEDITKILMERVSSAQRDLQVLEEKAVSKKSEISNGWDKKDWE